MYRGIEVVTFPSLQTRHAYFLKGKEYGNEQEAMLLYKIMKYFMFLL